MPHAPRSVQLVRDAVAAADSIVVLEQLRTLARAQYAGGERAELEQLIDRRAAELAALAEQLPLDVDDDYVDLDSDAG